MLTYFAVDVPLYVDIVVSIFAGTWPIAGFTAWWFFHVISKTNHREDYEKGSFAMRVVACIGCVLLGWAIYSAFLTPPARAELAEIYPARPP